MYKKESLIKSSHRKNVKTKGDKSIPKVYIKLLGVDRLLITNKFFCYRFP